MTPSQTKLNDIIYYIETNNTSKVLEHIDLKTFCSIDFNSNLETLNNTQMHSLKLNQLIFYELLFIKILKQSNYELINSLVRNSNLNDLNMHDLYEYFVKLTTNKIAFEFIKYRYADEILSDTLFN